MTSTAFSSPWEGVWSLDAIVNRRLRRPRTTGVTMVIDSGLGAFALRDLLAIAGEHIDHWKFGFGTSALMPLHDPRGEARPAPRARYPDLSGRHPA